MMKNRNIYKDIVILTVLSLLLSFAVKEIKSWKKEESFYGFTIQLDSDLTEEIGKEFQKISGLSEFEPADTIKVTLRLKEYAMETELLGIDLEEYPLKWEKGESEIFLGNRASLFFGKESFQLFTDQNGLAPNKSQIEKWIQEYQKLDLIVIDENGREKKAGVSGILKNPDHKICMEKNQMGELFEDAVRTKGGYMEIYGYQNAEKAKELLEKAGFIVESEDL
ncbi:MAG: hypothetical protein HFH41_13820 [Lachnospiraceae bacterium]|nr:hypothetical protein [Lachnospiraceae bacterium]